MKWSTRWRFHWDGSKRRRRRRRKVSGDHSHSHSQSQSQSQSRGFCILLRNRSINQSTDKTNSPFSIASSIISLQESDDARDVPPPSPLICPPHMATFTVGHLKLIINIQNTASQKNKIYFRPYTIKRYK